MLCHHGLGPWGSLHWGGGGAMPPGTGPTGLTAEERCRATKAWAHGAYCGKEVPCHQGLDPWGSLQGRGAISPGPGPIGLAAGERCHTTRAWAQGAYCRGEVPFHQGLGPWGLLRWRGATPPGSGPMELPVGERCLTTRAWDHGAHCRKRFQHIQYQIVLFRDRNDVVLV